MFQNVEYIVMLIKLFMLHNAKNKLIINNLKQQRI